MFLLKPTNYYLSYLRYHFDATTLKATLGVADLKYKTESNLLVAISYQLSAISFLIDLLKE